MNARVKQVKAAYGDTLLSRDGVHMVVPGRQITNGTPTGRDCLTVVVSQKLPVSQLAPDQVIPKMLAGVITDVIESEPFVAPRPFPASAFFVQKRIGGTSLGHKDITTGTAAILVTDKLSGKLLLLSNNHILANTNRARIGDDILWPGPIDGGQAVVAALERYEHIYMIDEQPASPDGCIPLARGLALMFGSQFDIPASPAAPVHNLIDAAVARLHYGQSFLSGIERIGLVSKSNPNAAAGMKVQKYGRTTNYTTGTIQYTDAMVDVGYGSAGKARFDNQIIITPAGFSTGGDSGSLIVDMENRAVALLFAGNGEMTIASPIETVMEMMGLAWQVIG